MNVSDDTVPGDDWDNGTASTEFHPDVLVEASNDIRNSAAIQPLEPFLELPNA